ncbi:MAG: tetratricopeptide repeat protein [Nitrospiraceae bacterium]|nr:MAG: tetratricopeptide repeat protein [Nitrospiraceae bacterium]
MGEISGKIKTYRKTPAYENRIWSFLHKPTLHILLITAVGLLAYSNTFDVPFQFDDSEFIVENPIIKDLTYFVEPSKAKALIEYEGFKLRYIGYLTFALNYYLHNLEVTGYHIFNLAVHIINALFVYWLVLLTLRLPLFRTTYSEVGILQAAPFGLHPNSIALFSALLFVSHPVQTQAVTYIWQRVASLATMFYLLSLMMYIKGRLIAQNTEYRTQILERDLKLSSLFCYLLSFVSAVLAMKTKGIAFTLPLIIALYEFMFFEGRLKRRILYLIPVLSTMLIIPLTLLGTDKPVGELISDVSEVTRVQTTMSRLDYLFTQFRVIVTYIRLLFLPINQNLDYDYPIYHSFFDPNVILSFLFIAIILGIGVYLLYRSRSASHHLRLIAFGIFWFFITLSVESGIIPIVDVIFEHRVYLPSIGFILVCVTGVAMLVERVNTKAVVRVIVAGVITGVIMLGGMTYGRNRVWQNEITLWEDVVKKSPEKSRPHNNLGKAYAEHNRLDEAITEYKAAIMFKPDFADAHHNLGVAYINQNRLDEAISEFKSTLQFNPYYADAHYHLGLAYRMQNRWDKAISEFKSALQIRPDLAVAGKELNFAYKAKKMMN